MSRETARALARPILRRLIPQGLSGTAILNELRARGLGYRTQDFFRDFRRITREFEASGRAKFIRKGARPTKDIIFRMPIGNPNIRYMYRVKVSGFSTILNAYIEKPINVSSRQLITRAKAEAIAEELIKIYRDEYPDRNLKFTLDSVFENEEFEE